MNDKSLTVCPLCAAKAQAEHATKVTAAQRRADQAYGKSPAERFVKYFQEVKRLRSNPPRRSCTLDEWIETEVLPLPGALTITYHASCHACGFTFKFEECIDMTDGQDRENTEPTHE